MCLLLAIIHSTFPKVLYWVGMHFLFTDGKIDRKRRSVLPGTNGLVRCLFKALGTAFFTWPGGSLLERHSTGLKAALRPLALLARGEQAEERPGSQLPLWSLFQMAVKITPRGQTFSSAFCPLTPADFEMTGFMFKGGSAATIWYASLGTCLLFDTSLSFSCKDSCACLQRNGTYCIPVHIHVVRGLDFHTDGWEGLTTSSRRNFSGWLQGVCYCLISTCRLEHLFWTYSGPHEELSDLELPLAPAAAVMAPFSWGRASVWCFLPDDSGDHNLRLSDNL